MQRYLQWLNPAFVQLALADTDNPNFTEITLLNSTETILKFHALLGTTILLNNVQIGNSPLLNNN